MKSKLFDFIVQEQDSILNALKIINANRQGFVVVVNKEKKVLGVLTDGDIRRSLIKAGDRVTSVSSIYTKNPKTVLITDDFEVVTELFKNPAIKFLPIIDQSGTLVNLITKSQMHALLLQDIHADLSYDFFSLDTSVVDYEIFQRPWGFFKTTVLNDYYQCKVISVKPEGKLSLQSHEHREEHWIVVHGTGIVQLDASFLTVTCGSSVFIPKGCRHRVTNIDKIENLVITEVQIGDYLGEDDIIRYEDDYGRD